MIEDIIILIIGIFLGFYIVEFFYFTYKNFKLNKELEEILEQIKKIRDENIENKIH